MNQKEILVISATIFLTIITWIMGDLFHVATTAKVKVADKRYSSEIKIVLDKQVLKTLQEKQ